MFTVKAGAYPSEAPFWGLYYKTFYGRNLRIFVMS